MLSVIYFFDATSTCLCIGSNGQAYQNNSWLHMHNTLLKLQSMWNPVTPLNDWDNDSNQWKVRSDHLITTDKWNIQFNGPLSTTTTLHWIFKSKLYNLRMLHSTKLTCIIHEYYNVYDNNFECIFINHEVHSNEVWRASTNKLIYHVAWFMFELILLILSYHQL